MVAPGNGIIIVAITLSIVISSTYALGRIHQWYRHGEERDRAYRHGYDEASLSLFRMAQEAGVKRAARTAAEPINRTVVRDLPRHARDVGAGRRRLTQTGEHRLPTAV